MNCTECGGALLLSRVVFRCTCGAYVHAYCADHHIIHAHRPGFEEGYVDLEGEFHLKQEPETVGELPMPEAEAESLILVEASPEGEEERGEEVEQKVEDIETVTEAPSDESEVQVETEVEAEPSEPERQVASSE